MNKKQIKIAQIIGKGSNGGVESIILNYYKHIDRRLFRFDFFIENETELINKKVIEKLGGRLFIIPSYKKLFSFIKTLKNIFLEEKYDIIHSNLNSLSVFPLYVAKKVKCPVRIAHSHSMSSKNEFIRNLVKSFLKVFSKKYATHFFACSLEAGTWLFGKDIINNKRFFIVNNGIQIDKFRYNSKYNDELREELGIKKDDFVFGIIGRFEKQKNHLFALKIFKQISKLYDNVKLILIGDGSLENEYRKFININNLSNFIFIVKPVNDVYKYYSLFNAFLFPSLYEGLGMVLIEAQVNGLKCFVSEFIPKEAIITQDVHVISISDQGKWLNDLTSNMYFYNREYNNRIEQKFDIDKDAAYLANIYKNAVGYFDF